jgi:hypothetical protein
LRTTENVKLPEQFIPDACKEFAAFIEASLVVMMAAVARKQSCEAEEEKGRKRDGRSSKSK